ncbi:MAG TPA: hypothetical protein VE973_03830 [Candidatus Limnocylindria bacterium]|nr:hypothetical protein [Candidatus Limnocylindria bacterium]
MKIATWNLFDKNQKQIETIGFLFKEKVDIACLQEVSLKTLEYLKTLELCISSCKAYNHSGTDVFSVMLSKVQPSGKKIIEFGVIKATFLDRISGLNQSGSSYQFNDYAIGKKTLRVFNIHMPFGSSASKHLVLLKNLLKMLHNDANIICGDFNSFGHFPWKIILGPINASIWQDYTTNELNELKKLFEEVNLKLSLENVVTYPLCQTHIDHIVIPKVWNNYTCTYYKARHGSDHRPVILQIADADVSL